MAVAVGTPVMQQNVIPISGRRVFVLTVVNDVMSYLPVLVFRTEVVAEMLQFRGRGEVVVMRSGSEGPL